MIQSMKEVFSGRSTTKRVFTYGYLLRNRHTHMYVQTTPDNRDSLVNLENSTKQGSSGIIMYVCMCMYSVFMSYMYGVYDT